MKSFKPAHAAAHEEARKEADKTGKPVRVKGVGTSDTPRLGPEYNEVDMTPIIRQLENIWQKLKSIEELLLKGTPKHVDPPKPIKTKNGHPVLSNGMVAEKIIEVPSFEQVKFAAQRYKEAHGQEALAQALSGFKAKRLSDLTDENKALFIERVSDDKPEGLEES